MNIVDLKVLVEEVIAEMIQDDHRNTQYDPTLLFHVGYRTWTPFRRTVVPDTKVILCWTNGFPAVDPDRLEKNWFTTAFNEEGGKSKKDVYSVLFNEALVD